jgi:hypothetical protein
LMDFPAPAQASASLFGPRRPDALILQAFTAQTSPAARPASVAAAWTRAIGWLNRYLASEAF